MANRVLTIVKPDNGYANCSTLENPWLIIPSKEDVARLLDTIKNLPIGTTTNRIRREQASPFCIVTLDLRPRFLEKVAAQVGEIW
jgi:hypothetical protein